MWNSQWHFTETDQENRLTDWLSGHFDPSWDSDSWSLPGKTSERAHVGNWVETRRRKEVLRQNRKGKMSNVYWALCTRAAKNTWNAVHTANCEGHKIWKIWFYRGSGLGPRDTTCAVSFVSSTELGLPGKRNLHWENTSTRLPISKSIQGTFLIKDWLGG